ncbi:hypothetical protein [Mobilicoccus caccae]|uniref:Uncharacterized protein n=1 Tax=Mobilicoccus caccae TaxID=1859295 RepID=A0ABQ6IY84_9MICO|nr:hypothetical protein [Mobilicoccus caccae]GMA42122.1 hypothetical protein GCM10025883_41670 [Mobilicoccus caccae]
MAADDMVRRFADHVGIPLRPASVALASGARVLVDGASAEESLFVAAHAGAGPLRHLDLVLVVQDVFTLALLRSERPKARAVVLVNDASVREEVAARIARTPAAGLVEIVEFATLP